jgi:hypothetical protein
METHGSVQLLRLGCDEGTNHVLRCFVKLEGLNYGDLLVGVVHEFVELANGLRLSTEVPS